jgi:hypothetical protein
MAEQAGHFRGLGERIPSHAKVSHGLAIHSREQKFVGPLPFCHAQYKLITFVRKCDRAARAVFCFARIEPDASAE